MNRDFFPPETSKPHSRRPRLVRLIVLGFLCVATVYFFVFADIFPANYPAEAAHLAKKIADDIKAGVVVPPKPELDRAAYDRKLLATANVSPTSLWHHYFLTGTTTGWKMPTSTASSTSASSTKQVVLRKEAWPVKAAYPNVGALLPFNRIVSYYGNFYSRQMGILGEYEPDVVIKKLKEQIAQWETADPSTPVIPAFNYIATTAQASAGRDGMYRARMPDTQVDQ